VADRITFEARGLRELEAALRKLPVDFQTDMLKPALEAGGEVLKRGMVQRVPRRTGATSGQIEARADVGKTAGVATVGILEGGKTGLAYRLRFIEFGTKAHQVVATAFQRTKKGRRRAGGKRALAAPGFGPRVKVEIPAISAKHPLARTIEEDSPRAIFAFSKSLYEALRAFCARQPGGSAN
jgi:HK97 gp10 family phage protein